jgi:hypothetical protein
LALRGRFIEIARREKRGRARGDKELIFIFIS